jgi:hypothetical protein
MYIFNSNKLRLYKALTSNQNAVNFSNHITKLNNKTRIETIMKKVKVKQSRYRPGVAQRVPGS